MTTTTDTLSPGLMTDRYELSMLSSFIETGSVNNKATFEAFARKLPTGRRYGVVAGLGRLIPAIQNFTFTSNEIDYLRSTGAITDATADYLTGFRFTGDIYAYPEGDLYFANSPVLTVHGTLGECVILETLILSILNHDSAIASTAARMVNAASHRPLIEMGSRRTHEQSAIAAARAAYLTGFAYTSNLAAGYLHNIPTTGTAAHAFTLAHPNELDAFRAQIAAHGTATTLLIDTYDIEQGIRNAVTAAREAGATGPGGIRIDSGDLNEEARKARILLDTLNATDTRITVTSDLDEYVLTDLADAPVDGYGIGTRLVTAHPAGFVYKLVEVADTPGSDAPMRPVAKKASGKVSVGGRKTAYREYSPEGIAVREVFTVNNNAVAFAGRARHMQVPVILNGAVVHSPTLEAVRAHHAEAIATLPAEVLTVTDGDPYLVAELSPAIEKGFTMTNETKRALLIVDVQNDFIEGGSLAVTGGTQVATDISTYLNTNAANYALIVASKDYHDAEGTNHGHFAAPGQDPNFTTTWPRHCVAGTTGSDYAPQLDTTHIDLHVRKGQGEAAYSMFEATDDHSHTLADILHSNHITAVDVVGIATDYCVKATALDARKHSLTVRLLADMSAGVAPTSTDAALTDMAHAGITII